jgi:hypothetical protein
MPADTPLWTQFRRLLLGTLIEVLQAANADVDLRSVAIEFDQGSEFRVPRLNNYMRFVGSVEARLDTPLADIAVLRAQLDDVWPSILSVVVMPVGDKLTSTRNQTSADVAGDKLVIRFDMVAD